ncbi:MAG: hypothetical protein OEW45_10895 [Deltaproteobacteria bacterium]|nr:hypothetical protein [Deltaproteobacteria bacterium]
MTSKELADPFGLFLKYLKIFFSISIFNITTNPQTKKASLKEGGKGWLLLEGFLPSGVKGKLVNHFKVPISRPFLPGVRSIGLAGKVLTSTKSSQLE